MKLALILVVIAFVISVNSFSTSSTKQTDQSVDFRFSRTQDENDIRINPEFSTLSSGILNSFENVTYWAEMEELVFEFSSMCIEKLKREIQVLEEYVKDYETTTRKAVQHSRGLLKTMKGRAELVASDGLASYRMTYRYVHILQHLKEIMAFNFLDSDLHDILWKKHPEEEDFEYFGRNPGSILPDWPNRIDLAFAMHSLIHIQEVYNYDYKDLPIVLSPKTRKPPQFNAFHCAEIGMHALYRKHYAVAIEWLEHAVEKIIDAYDSSIPLPVLESYLELAAGMHNKVLQAAGTAGTSEYSETIRVENLFVHTVDPFLITSQEMERISTYQLKAYGGLRESDFVAADFNGICSGMDFRTVQERSTLYCWYDTDSSPARTILPYKKELISFEPEVVQVYDFLGDKLISSLVNDKEDCSGISYTEGESTFFEMMRSRTATTCWPKDSELQSLWRKVSSVTLADLRSEGSHDLFQVVDYLFGRFYAVHMDSIQLATDNLDSQAKVAMDGDRLFSMLFYLNDVPAGAGGSTPFCNSGTAARPVKGSVVIWKNVYRNGSARRDTWHGSCPVIYGHKQVAVALIRSHSQFLTYPCTLNQNE